MGREPRELSQDDVLHASYSRNMARESMKKALLKFAKDKGVNDAEIWSHGDQWAMRFTNADGEPRMALIGDVFAKARGTILSLAKPRVAMSSNNSLASQIAQLQKRYPKVQFSPAPNGGIKVRAANAIFVAKDINAVISRLGKAMSLSRNSTEDSKGQPIKEGDRVKVSSRYGGGTAVVKAVMNGFVQLSNGKSYSGSDVTVLRPA